MRILYLLYSFTTGGTERLVADICNEMSSRGNSVYLYIVNDLYDDSMLRAVNPDVQVTLYRRKPSGGGKLKAILDLTRFICKNRIDVIHCNCPNTPELLLLKPIAFPKVKVVYTIHNMASYPGFGRIKVLYRNLLCRRLIAISESVRKTMLAAGAAGKKLVTVYNAIDVSRFPEPASKQFDAGSVTIGCVARIVCALKGQDVLLHAIALLKDRYPELKCLLAGSADAAHQNDLEQLKEIVRTQELERNVSFLGNCEDVPGFLSTLDIFILPSRSEGFGISLVEALAMGLPCIASDLDGPREILEAIRCGILVPDGDPQALADVISKVIENYTFYREQAQTVVPAIRSQYDIPTMCDKLLTAYL